MNMHDIFSKVSNTTQGITSSLKREAQNLYAQYQQNVQNAQNPNQVQNMNMNNMGNMNQNGNSSTLNHNNMNLNMGNEENPFLQVNIPPGTIPPGTYITVGQYQVMVERHLAEGGFAHVYVVQSQSGKKAVLKQIVVPDQEQVKNFQKEINFMKSVSGNENIVQYYDSQIRVRNKNEGEGFEVLILMEYCSEGHVVDLMNSRLKVRLTENEIINIFYSVCKAVAHLHYQNPPIIHRDIKVENVLITSDKKYKLCDFGSATTEIIPPNKALNIQEIRNLEDEIQKYTTIQYRPPEMCDLYQRRGLNEKVDTWALGVMLYKLCYYTTPFEDGNTLAIVNCSYTKPQTPVYSNHIHHLIDIMLVVEPSLRANIYDILSYVSSILNVPCPITNKYGFNDTSIANNNNNNNNSPFFSTSSTNSVLTSVKQPVVTVPIVQNPNPVPMRRGRPNQKERKSNNNIASNANAVVASKLATLSYNSQQMQQSTNDSFKTPITISPPNEGKTEHLSSNITNKSNITESNTVNKVAANPSGGGESGSFFTKYSQDNNNNPNNTVSKVTCQISGSNEKATADQSMLDNIFGKSTNNLFEESTKNGNNINVFDDDWVVDNSKNSFDKLSEKHKFKDNFGSGSFFSSNDLFNNDTNNVKNSKKIPRPPSFTQLASESTENDKQQHHHHTNRRNSNLSKFKSDPFILSNTNPFTQMENNDDQNKPLFEANFDDNFGDNFDSTEFNDNQASLFGNEIKNESKNTLTSPQKQKSSQQKNRFSDSSFNDPNDSYGYAKIDDEENVFSPKSPSIKITNTTPPLKSSVSVSPSNINASGSINNSLTFGNENNLSPNTVESNKRNSLKESKEKDKSDSVSNHSLQSTSKLNHSFQRLAMSLKKKQKQKKHILLDDNSYEDEDDEDDEDDDFNPYTQMEDDEDNDVLISNENLSPVNSGSTKYLSDPPQSNNIKIHHKSKSVSRIHDNHKSKNIENNNELSRSYENKKSPIISPNSIRPTSFVMSPINKATPVTTSSTKPKKKAPPPVPPKPKELKKYVIPTAYPGIPARQSSMSNRSPQQSNNNSNSEKDDPLKINANPKVPNISNMKISPINESTTSLSSTNLNNDIHRHSGYYYDNEDMVQQLDDTFTNITDEMENYPNDDSDQDIFNNNGKVKRRSKFKYLH